MSNELVEVEESTALQAFSSDGGLDSIVQQVKDTVAEFDHDMSTQASRGRTASLANKVARMKTRLDGLGKSLTDDWAKKKKAVDANRKAMRDELDALKVEVRKPLTEWEEEQKRLEEIEAAKKIQEEINRDHEMAELMNAEFDRKRAEAIAEEKRLEAERKAQIEKERLEREALIAQQAKEQAEREAKQREAKLEQDRLDAIAAQEQAKRDAIAVEERAKIQAEQAEIRRQEDAKRAKEFAKQQAEAAKQDEIKRQQDELDRQAAELAKREANKAHQKKINNGVKQVIMTTGVGEELAVEIVKALYINSKSDNPLVTINY